MNLYLEKTYQHKTRHYGLKHQTVVDESDHHLARHNPDLNDERNWKENLNTGQDHRGNHIH